MIEKLKNKLFEGFDIENDPFLYRRLIMSSSMLFIALFAFVAFVFINIATQKYLLACFDSAVIIVTLVAIYLLFFKKKIEFSAILATSVLLIFLVLFSYANQNDSFGLVWTLCFPLFVIPVLGSNRGILTIIIFYSFIFPIAYFGIDQWDHGFWNTTAFLRFTIASITVVFAAYFFETSARDAYQTIFKNREKEKIYLKTLESLSITDQLTGLNNRRYFDQHYQVEVEKIKRYDNTLCLIMIDIDLFKSINDEFGHQVGDDVLVEFANLLKSQIRKTDFLARWGGEEFMLLLPRIDLPNAAIIAEKLRLAVSEHDFCHGKRMTISLGVTRVLHSDISERDSIQDVDDALYQAKKQGRNQVHIHVEDNSKAK